VDILLLREDGLDVAKNLFEFHRALYGFSDSLKQAVHHGHVAHAMKSLLIQPYLHTVSSFRDVRAKSASVEHDLETARSIQQSLLPKIRPTISGLQISGWNLPADATGGDYFD
jgi:hypothetical protein